jgi:hypothetical protein
VLRNGPTHLANRAIHRPHTKPWVRDNLRVASGTGLLASIPYVRILAAIAVHHAPIVGTPAHCHIMLINRRSRAAALCYARLQAPPAH